jgi:hypothetical protein
MSGLIVQLFIADSSCCCNWVGSGKATIATLRKGSRGGGPGTHPEKG